MQSPPAYARLLVDGEPRWALLRGGDAGEPIAELLDKNPALGGARLLGEARPAADLAVLVPVEPGKILGIGTNYRAHAAEMGKPVPEEPLLFMKPPSSLLPPRGAIVRPGGYARVDFEGELGVVIGRRARHVPVGSALEHVFGYTCVNDVTVRDLQKKDVQFTRAKGFDTFCPTGPIIVPAAALPDPQRLPVRTRVNGVSRQDSSTADMVFSVAELIAFISRFMTLEPGDLITTGTPQGVGNLEPGDVVEVEVEGVGVLSNPVVAP